MLWQIYGKLNRLISSHFAYQSYHARKWRRWILPNAWQFKSQSLIHHASHAMAATATSIGKDKEREREQCGITCYSCYGLASQYWAMKSTSRTALSALQPKRRMTGMRGHSDDNEKRKSNEMNILCVYLFHLFTNRRLFHLHREITHNNSDQIGVAHTTKLLLQNIIHHHHRRRHRCHQHKKMIIVPKR